jgi:predicted ATPase/DNA-binding winged helix-turn-helix (wHTH) protein
MKLFDSFGLDLANECLWQHGTQIALPPKPFAVLRYLVENPGRLITHEELLDALWPETYVQPQVLRTYMLDLRKVLGDDAAQPRFIQTLPKRGYCFLATVTDAAIKDHQPGLKDHTDRGAAAPSETSAPAANSDHPGTTPEKTAAPPPDSSQPLPSSYRIVGREAELADLHAQMQRLSARQRRVVLITGEVGIGKTALVDAFRRQVSASQRVSVALGQCVEGFRVKEEYYPVMEALGQLCAAPDGERACRVLSKLAPHWLASAWRQEPHAASSPESASTASPDRQRMPGDLCAALEELAAEKPLILIFEDVHLADDATLHLISALARRQAPARLMVLATCRTRLLSGEHPLRELKQDLLMRRLCVETSLQPLSRRAVKELLAHELRQKALPPGLADFVHRHSEGNPLFVIAILEHLIAQRFVERVGDGVEAVWQQRAPFREMEAGVPDGLSQMIELEMERLSLQEQRMLEAASLTTVAFPAWAVAAALQADPGEIEEALDDLARRLYFVERAGQDELPDGSLSAFYVFTHGLYREVLYQRQATSRRAKRHIRIAERLSELFAGRKANVAREIAMHYEAAGDWRRAVDALCEAARQAQQRNAEAEASESLEHALRIAGHLSEHELEAAMEGIQTELVLAHASRDMCNGKANGSAAPTISREEKTQRKLDVFWTGT